MAVDPNPLRTAPYGPVLPVVAGAAQLPEEQGLGAEPDPASLRAFSNLSLELRAPCRTPGRAR
jgi:hypothetical protein